MQLTMFDFAALVARLHLAGGSPGLLVLDTMYLNSDELAMMSGLNVALKETRQISYSLGPTAVFPVLEATAAAADDFRVSTAEFQSFLRSAFFLPVDPKTGSVFTYDVQIPLCLQKPAVNIRLTRWNPTFFFSPDVRRAL